MKGNITSKKQDNLSYNFKESFKEIEDRIGHRYFNIDNLKTALTHSSYANEGHIFELKSKKNTDSLPLEKKPTKNCPKNAVDLPKIVSNERLEFLGDSVLNVVITEHLFNAFPKLPEGELTKLRACIVCESTLAKCSRTLGVGEFLMLGKGERISGGNNRESILADTFEAIIGSIFIDEGYNAAKIFILKMMENIILNLVKGQEFLDYKTLLQELVQKTDSTIEYSIIEETGPAHDRIFMAQVKIDQKISGEGDGKTKKEAEQRAAQKAYKAINNFNN